jgi:TM2 domain-containing membrane protein YozV
LQKTNIENMNEKSDKKRLVAFLLCFFLGCLGIHRFYVGKVGTAILQIFTFGGLGIWCLVDTIMILVGSFKDKQGRKLEDWT